MTSDMPKRYIDREGVDEMEIANIIRPSPASGLQGNDKETVTDQENKSVQTSGGSIPGQTSPISILQVRLARGEIDLPMFQQLKAELGAPMPCYVG